MTDYPYVVEDDNNDMVDLKVGQIFNVGSYTMEIIELDLEKDTIKCRTAHTNNSTKSGIIMERVGYSASELVQLCKDDKVHYVPNNSLVQATHILAFMADIEGCSKIIRTSAPNVYYPDYVSGGMQCPPRRTYLDDNEYRIHNHREKSMIVTGTMSHSKLKHSGSAPNGRTRDAHNRVLSFNQGRKGFRH